MCIYTQILIPGWRQPGWTTRNQNGYSSVRPTLYYHNVPLLWPATSVSQSGIDWRSSASSSLTGCCLCTIDAGKSLFLAGIHLFMTQKGKKTFCLLLVCQGLLYLQNRVIICRHLALTLTMFAYTVHISGLYFAIRNWVEKQIPTAIDYIYIHIYIYIYIYISRCA